MSLSILINEVLPLPKTINATAFIETICALKHIKSGQFEFNFVTDQLIQKINKDHLNHDYPTDTITFNLGDNHTIEADIYISLETASTNAKLYDTPLETEIKLYIIHCILHCLGYDDGNSTDKKVMETEQSRLLHEIN